MQGRLGRRGAGKPSLLAGFWLTGVELGCRDGRGGGQAVTVGGGCRGS